jgi:multiple sugar transport system substrate-binding protein
MALLTANRAPEVVTIGDDFVPFFVEQEYFISLEDLDTWKDFKIEKYYPGLLDPGKVNGKQYFLPVSYSPLALYYNRRLFDERKVPYPTNNWTWNDLLGAAQKLTIDRDRDGIPEQWGIQMNANWESGFEYWVAAAGGRLISEDGKKFTGYMDSPESIRALRFYSDLYHKYRVAPPPADLQGWAGGNTEFMNGTAAMLIFGYWPQEGFLKNPRIDLGVAPLPRDKVRANILFWEGGGITKSSEHPEESFDYLMYFADNKSVDMWEGIELPITIRQPLSTSPPTDPFRTVWLGELQYLIPRTYTFTPYWEETGRYILNDALLIAITDPEADPAYLLRQAAKEAQTKLDFYQK